MHTFAIATAVLAAAAGAQTLIQPSSVPLSTRQQWCTAQKQQCPLLCTQINDGSAAYISNDCFADTLDYSCVCANGQSPNSTEYSNTLPYFECTMANEQCAAACGGAEQCQSACMSRHCGASDPKRYNVTATPTLSTALQTGTGAAPTGVSGAQSINGNSAGLGGGETGAAAGALVASVGRVYGMGVVLGGVFAGVAIFL